MTPSLLGIRADSVLSVIVDRGLVERLEQVEVTTVERLVEALAATGAVDPVPTAVAFGHGLLVLTGNGRYVNRAVGITLDQLAEHDVAAVIAHYDAAGLPPAVQLSSWAPEVTVSVLGRAGFVPVSCRSVFASVATARGRVASTSVTVVPVNANELRARDSREVMSSGTSSVGPALATSDAFMVADNATRGTAQFLALRDGQPVGCGSLTIVETSDGLTGWLGAAATVPSARRRGVQTALVQHRLELASEAGCDVVGATATTGSASSRVLQRCGFTLAQDQWVVQRDEP